MTIKEAIKHLKEAREYPVAYTKEEQEAYEMAFSALFAQQDAQEKSMTNADHIREMTDEELSKILICIKDLGLIKSCPVRYCCECCLDWLKQPYEGGGDDGKID
jgi:hypothetical protein